MPVVGRALQTVQPSIDFAWNKYLEAHDALVTAPSYNKCVLRALPSPVSVGADSVLCTQLRGGGQRGVRT